MISARWQIVSMVVGCLLLPAAARPDTTGSATDGPGFGLYGGVYKTEQETIDSVRKCREHGIAALHPSLSGGATVLWKTDGEPYYPDFKDVMDGGYDALEILIRHAHEAGIKVYPSVAVCAASRMLEGHPEWETHDREGRPSSETTGRSFALSYPEARAAKIAIIMDLVNGYDVDGVMLDYCRYPENSKSEKTKYGFYGYDPPLIEACKSIHGFDPRLEPIDSPKWNLFNQMREDTVTAFVREFREAVTKSGRDIRIGGFGDTDPPLEARMCGRNCVAWARAGLIDDYYLATYVESIDEMSSVVAKVRRAAGPNVALLSALTPFNNFLKTNDEMVSAARAQLSGGADGLWIYREDFLEKLDLWKGAAAAARLAAE